MPPNITHQVLPDCNEMRLFIKRNLAFDSDNWTNWTFRLLYVC